MPISGMSKMKAIQPIDAPVPTSSRAINSHRRDADPRRVQGNW